MVTSAHLEGGVTAATNYILNKRSDNGLWCDFHTLAGSSADWVSGFVIYALARVDDVEQTILDVLKRLLRRQRPNGGWSYNEIVPTDCDSTAWVLLSFLTAPSWKPSSIARAVRYVKRHQIEASGGFATYSSSDNIESFIGVDDRDLTTGWRDAHPCVTGVVLQSLLAHGEQIESHCVQSAAKYLLERREPAGVWQSYWWKGFGYSTYHSMRALAMARALRASEVSKTCSYLLEQQHEDGGWSDSAGDKSDVFATAFIVLALLLFPDETRLEAVERGTAWLLKQQNEDGGWPSAPILRIPPPMVHDPETVKDWRTNDEGTGVVIEDQDAIFTSAAALWSLAVFKSMIQ